MLITDAINALEAAKEVLGDDARLFVSLPGAGGWTSDCLQFIGPVELGVDPSKKGITLVVIDRVPELMQPDRLFCGASG